MYIYIINNTGMRKLVIAEIMKNPPNAEMSTVEGILAQHDIEVWNVPKERIQMILGVA